MFWVSVKCRSRTVISICSNISGFARWGDPGKNTDRGQGESRSERACLNVNQPKKKTTSKAEAEDRTRSECWSGLSPVS